jgi:hypothetical protein
MTDPLHPSAALLCKLGSIIVHADEFHSPDGHPFDLEAMKSGMDAEVNQWIDQMQRLGMIPIRRRK